MKVATPLAKNILAPLEVTAAASAIVVRIQKKIHGSGIANLVVLNEEINGITKILQALEDSNILLKGFTKTTNNETKELKEGSLNMFLGTLGASLLGIRLAGRGIIKADSGNKKRKGIVRAGSKRMGFLMPHHPSSSNFVLEKYYEDEPLFNGVCSRKNLPKK